MEHIEEWPTVLNFDTEAFGDEERERDFWGHLSSCDLCKGKLPERLEPFCRESVKTEIFWEEVDRFLSNIHPDLEHLAYLVSRGTDITYRLGFSTYGDDEGLTEKVGQAWDSLVEEERLELTDYLRMLEGVITHMFICIKCFRSGVEVKDLLQLRYSDKEIIGFLGSEK